MDDYIIYSHRLENHPFPPNFKHPETICMICMQHTVCIGKFHLVPIEWECLSRLSLIDLTVIDVKSVI